MCRLGGFQEKVHIVGRTIVCLAKQPQIKLSFLERYGKLYSQDEELYRKSVWEEEMKVVAEHNAEAEVGALHCEV